jgi:cell division protein FtsB
MIVRTRLASILMPLAFHAFAAAVGGFFVWHAFHGERGIEADFAYRRQMSEIEAKLAVVRAEKAVWRKRIDLLRGPEIDRDLLDEEARNLLNRVNKTDLLVFLPRDGASAAADSRMAAAAESRTSAAADKGMAIAAEPRMSAAAPSGRN